MTLQELMLKQGDLTEMKSDVIGRVSNTRLSKKDALLPLFEAIINSIDAIQDRPDKDKGSIEIHIKRDAQQSIFKDDDSLKECHPVASFVIVDNGVGFNEKNYTSFLTSDSRLKEAKGGKGIGRFLWLKAFNQVRINSIFSENGSFHSISFDFLLRAKPIQNFNFEVAATSKFRTVVELEQIRQNYKDEVPEKSEKIALRILEHFLIFFLSDQCPEITVIDAEEGSSINLNDEFNKKIKPYISHASFTLKKQKFNITYLRLHSAYKADHTIRLCADQREVTSDSLAKLLPDLTKQKLYDDISHEEFTLVTYVSSGYLNKFVNYERTDFDFPEPEEKQRKIDESFEISKQEIFEKIVGRIQKQFSKTLGIINRDKIKRIEKFISSEKPIYRPLLKYAPDRVEKIPANLPEEKLDIEMHKLYHKLEIEAKEEGQRFFDPETGPDEGSPEYEEEYEKYLNKIDDLKASKLAEYVMHRKTILNLLEKSLRLQANGKPQKEDRVHRLLYPPKTASDENEFVNHNLWIIDEKLTYHTYLASDLRFDQMSHIESESQKRPDILIYPTAFVEENYPYDSIVIIEIKRPERKDYSDTDKGKDPIQQVIGYIKDLKAGRARDENGSILAVNDETRFYCYIVADMTPKLKDILGDKDYAKTIDADGYFYFHKIHKAYIEVISFRKLLEDSKKRNRVLFEKLGLPL